MAAADFFSEGDYPLATQRFFFKHSPTNRSFGHTFIGNFPPFTGSLLCFA
jgi:hypothetical protein